MTETPTRIGTPVHPHVFFRGEMLALVSMRLHLAECERWEGRLSNPVFINYARTKAGCIVQFEESRNGYDFSCHVPLKVLRKADFDSNCPLKLVEFAQQAGLSAEGLMVESLIHAQSME